MARYTVAFALMAFLAPVSGAAQPPLIDVEDQRSDLRVPPRLLALATANSGDLALETWSQANARQAVAYSVGYAFGYEQVRNLGCETDVFGTSFGETFNFRDLVTSTSSRVLNIVTANNDTLYTFAGLALDAEPVVFTAPDDLDVNDRYWSLMLQDMASNVPHVLGSESTGTGDFVIAWSGWNGPLPKNLRVFEMDSPFVYALVRTGVTGPDDLPAVHAIQDQYAYTPLSVYCSSRKGKDKCKFHGKGPAAPKPSRASEMCARYPENFNSTPTGIAAAPLAFWEGVNVVTDINPPPSYEEGLLQMYKDILVGPGQPEDLQENPGDYPPLVIQALENAPPLMAPLLLASVTSLSDVQDGWSVLRILGEYGNLETGDPYEYLARGAVNMAGPGGLPASEALYYLSFADAAGQPLNAAVNSYELRLPGPPPVGAFWSLTLYTDDGFLYDNGDDGSTANDVYSIGTFNAQAEPDGSIVITISHSADASPPLGATNWLPAPAGGLYLAFRTYVPLEPATYFPPALVIQ